MGKRVGTLRPRDRTTDTFAKLGGIPPDYLEAEGGSRFSVPSHPDCHTGDFFSNENLCSTVAYVHVLCWV
jgi:hypothetical protein